MSGCVLPRGRAYQGAVVLNAQKVPPAAISLSSSSRGMYGSCLSFPKITSAWISGTRQNQRMIQRDACHPSSAGTLGFLVVVCLGRCASSKWRIS